MEKVERYNWAKPGDSGRKTNVPVNDLHVDHSYQRKEVTESNTLAIARDFSWVLFGTLVCMRRANGLIVIIDGQQRWMAAKKRGDIATVPCIIFESEGRDHEAAAFMDINKKRKVVSAVDSFRAAVVAKREPEIQINEWLESVGLKIMDKGGVTGIDFPRNIIFRWNLDANASKSAILVQREIIGTESCHTFIFLGLWHLIHNGVEVKPYIKKLQEAGGKAALLRAIRQYRIETDMAATAVACGNAILRLINFRKSNKVSIRTEE